MPLPPFCDSTDQTLRLCYDFEADAPARVTDGSAYMNHSTPPLGTIDHAAGAGQALVCGENAYITIRETASLDVAAYTIEMWIRPDALPTTVRMGLFDNNGQYGMFINPNVNLTCSGGGGLAQTADNIFVVGRWYHVACTNDGASVRAFIDGVEVASRATGALNTAQPDGSALCDNVPYTQAHQPFVGRVDNVRIFSTARTTSQFCLAANGCAVPTN